MVNSTHYGYLIALRDDVDYSTGPGGLSTNGYEGHVFWDMDTWVYPTLNLFHPSLGDSHLRFRRNGMVGAAALALSKNQSGLMYPWETTPNGFTANNGGMAGAEPHVTGDVAVAFWNRWRATHDVQFLRAVAWPVIEGVAEFWSKRLTCPPDVTQPCWIRCVSGPDEFHMCKDREVPTSTLPTFSRQ
jgi:trehalose/maltose hydrolase-like predicted phosphorylase